MSTAPDTRLADLPPIFWATLSAAPIPPMRRPYLDRDVICATNGRIAVEAPARLFRPGVIARLRPRLLGVPDVDRDLRRWRGDGRTHRLPGWDDDRHPPESAVRVGWTPLMRRWVAFLLCHQVRVVETGRTADDPVRFNCGVAEGLLRP